MRYQSDPSHNFVAALAGILPAGVPVALLDFPWHDNPGDAAIWKGEVFALAKLGHRVVYTATIGTFDCKRLDRLLPDKGVVLLHGGGNFGDHWPEIHSHRLSIVDHLRSRPIVQLPQTVHFDDDAAGAETLARLAVHHDLTLMARDQRSFESLSQAGFRVCLSKDPTSALWPEPPIAQSPAGPKRVLFLLRSDSERQRPIPGALVSVARDWDGLGVTSDNTTFATRVLDFALNTVDGVQKRGGRALPASCRARMTQQRSHSDRLVAAAVQALLEYDVIVTDRLHAMLFGLAYGREVVAVDSGYGKLDSYIDTFLTEEPLLHHLSSFDELPHILERVGTF